MGATPRETDAVEHEIRVGARPETIFSYFTDPVKMVQWMGVEATLDPRPGGICRIAFHPTRAAAEMLDAPFGREQKDVTARLEPNGARVMMGRFEEVDPNRRIAFTWGWEEDLYKMPPQSTAVEVVLTPDGQSTIVSLVHRRLPSAAAAAIHHAGWQHYLSRLAIAAAGGNPGADPGQRA